MDQGGANATPDPILNHYRGRGTVCPSTARGVAGRPAPDLRAWQHGQHSILNSPPTSSQCPFPHFQGSPGTGREGEGWLQTPLPHRSLSTKILIYSSVALGVGRVSACSQVPPSLSSAHLPRINVPGLAILPLPHRIPWFCILFTEFYRK